MLLASLKARPWCLVNNTRTFESQTCDTKSRGSWILRKRSDKWPQRPDIRNLAVTLWVADIYELSSKCTVLTEVRKSRIWLNQVPKSRQTLVEGALEIRVGHRSGTPSLMIFPHALADFVKLDSELESKFSRETTNVLPALMWEQKKEDDTSWDLDFVPEEQSLNSLQYWGLSLFSSMMLSNTQQWSMP